MFGEGPGTREELCKANAEIRSGSLGNNDIIERKELLNKSGMEIMFRNASKLAEHFIKNKKEKLENS